MVIVHPEAVRVGPAGFWQDPTDNRLPGVVRDVSFLGRLQELIVDVGGIDLRAVQVRGAAFDVGARIEVAISAADIILI